MKGHPADSISESVADTLSDSGSTAVPKKVGLIGLVAIVVSAMVGGGVFNLPSEMSETASAGSQIIAWIITGTGMWFIASTFRKLSALKPDLKNGIFAYAKVGFGRLAGFFIAYGYWICNCFSQAAYGVLIMATMDSFFPGVFGDGNNLISIACASVICWCIYFTVRKGTHIGAALNIVGTIGKIVPILVFIIMMITVFQFSVFVEDFWGRNAQGAALSFSLEGVGSQVSSTMLITLFLFVGIEGAVVLSEKARDQHDVSKATTLGYILVLVLYVLVTLLPLGVYGCNEIAAMRNPSMAAIMSARFGWWGGAIVNIGIIISVLSAWLVWIMMLSQMPLFAAREGLFPKRFTKVNAKGEPTFSLLVTTLVCQTLLILCLFVDGGAWQKMVSVTSVMAMPCYLMCCLYLWKLSLPKHWPLATEKGRLGARATGIVGSVFGVYLLYASGIDYLLVACLLYAAGIPLYIIGRRQSCDGHEGCRLLTRREVAFVVMLLLLGLAGIIYKVVF